MAKKKNSKSIPDGFLIRSPEEEYKFYVEQQIEKVVHGSEEEKANLYQDALDLGLRILNNLRQNSR